MKKSKFLTVNDYDIIKSVIVAILSGSLTALYNLLQSGTILGNEQWKAILIAGICAGLGYLLKNVLTNNQGELFKGDVFGE